MILRTTILLSALALGVVSASAQVTHHFQTGGHHSDSHRHLQRWNHPHTGLARHSGSNHSQGYVRNSGPRFNGPHRDW